MENIERNELSIEKLVDQAVDARRKLTGKIRREVLPTIRRHKANNSVWYTYCHGRGHEIYLGTADTILKAMKGQR